MVFSLPKENRRRREKIFELFAIGVMLCVREKKRKREEGGQSSFENRVVACGGVIVQSYTYLYLESRHTFLHYQIWPFLFVSIKLLMYVQWGFAWVNMLLSVETLNLCLLCEPIAAPHVLRYLIWHAALIGKLEKLLYNFFHNFVI